MQNVEPKHSVEPPTAAQRRSRKVHKGKEKNREADDNMTYLHDMLFSGSCLHKIWVIRGYWELFAYLPTLIRGDVNCLQENIIWQNVCAIKYLLDILVDIT